MSGVKRSLVDIQNDVAKSAFEDLNGVAFVTGQPTAPVPNTIYIDNQNNVLYYVNSGGQLFSYPFTEGSLVANTYTASDAAVTTTTGTSWLTKLSLTENFPNSVYMVIVSYGWNYDDGGSDFQGRLTLDGVQQGEIHQQEPKDTGGTFATTGTNQRHYLTRVFLLPLNGSQTLDVQLQSSIGGVEASMWDASIVAINLAGLN